VAELDANEPTISVAGGATPHRPMPPSCRHGISILRVSDRLDLLRNGRSLRRMGNTIQFHRYALKMKRCAA
jgi:hypothetical protein